MPLGLQARAVMLLLWMPATSNLRSCAATAETRAREEKGSTVRGSGVHKGCVCVGGGPPIHAGGAACHLFSCQTRERPANAERELNCPHVPPAKCPTGNEHAGRLGRAQCSAFLNLYLPGRRAFLISGPTHGQARPRHVPGADLLVPPGQRGHQLENGHPPGGGARGHQVIEAAQQLHHGDGLHFPLKDKTPKNNPVSRPFSKRTAWPGDWKTSSGSSLCVWLTKCIQSRKTNLLTPFSSPVLGTEGSEQGQTLPRGLRPLACPARRQSGHLPSTQKQLRARRPNGRASV